MPHDIEDVRCPICQGHTLSHDAEFDATLATKLDAESVFVIHTCCGQHFHFKCLYDVYVAGWRIDPAYYACPQCRRPIVDHSLSRDSGSASYQQQLIAVIFYYSIFKGSSYSKILDWVKAQKLDEILKVLHTCSTQAKPITFSAPPGTEPDPQRVTLLKQLKQRLNEILNILPTGSTQAKPIMFSAPPGTEPDPQHVRLFQKLKQRLQDHVQVQQYVLHRKNPLSTIEIVDGIENILIALEKNADLDLTLLDELKKAIAEENLTPSTPPGVRKILTGVIAPTVALVPALQLPNIRAVPANEEPTLHEVMEEFIRVRRPLDPPPAEPSSFGPWLTVGLALELTFLAAKIEYMATSIWEIRSGYGSGENMLQALRNAPSDTERSALATHLYEMRKMVNQDWIVKSTPALHWINAFLILALLIWPTFYDRNFQPESIQWRKIRRFCGCLWAGIVYLPTVELVPPLIDLLLFFLLLIAPAIKSRAFRYESGARSLFRLGCGMLWAFIIWGLPYL